MIGYYNHIQYNTRFVKNHIIVKLEGYGKFYVPNTYETWHIEDIICDFLNNKREIKFK